MGLEVRRLVPERSDDFFRVHCAKSGADWCRCVAWWVDTWEGWGERTAEENLALRRDLFAAGEHDGYLLYDAGDPVGWCQVGPRDRLAKLVGQFGLEPDPAAWAITCFLIAPECRGRGAARFLLAGVLDDLPRRGARRIEAFPKRGEGLDALDLWGGPEAMFREAGFEVVREDDERPILARALCAHA